MEFETLLKIVKEEPVFDTGFLLAGNVDSGDVRRQLSRWKKTGRIYQLRRGLYTLSEPFQKVKPHPFLVANRMVRGSYVSLQSAMAYYNLIPEYVAVITSVTTGRPGHWDTPLGSYDFRHIKTGLFCGYRTVKLAGNQEGFVATPEKALLDIVHLQDNGDSEEYLIELRLQNLERLNPEELKRQADMSGSPKLKRAADVIMDMVKAEKKGYREV